MRRSLVLSIRHLPPMVHVAQAAEAALASGADALVTIDSPDFCLRVAGIVKATRPDLRVLAYAHNGVEITVTPVANRATRRKAA